MRILFVFLTSLAFCLPAAGQSCMTAAPDTLEWAGRVDTYVTRDVQSDSYLECTMVGIDQHFTLQKVGGSWAVYCGSAQTTLGELATASLAALRQEETDEQQVLLRQMERCMIRTPLFPRL